MKDKNQERVIKRIEELDLNNKSSIHINSEGNRGWIILYTIINIVFMLFISVDKKMIENMVDYNFNLSLAFLGITLTAYTIFLSFLSEKMKKTMLLSEENYLLINNNAFRNIIIWMFILLVLNGVLKIYIPNIVYKDFIECIKTRTVLTKTILVGYMTFNFKYFIEIKSIVKNIYDLLNLSSSIDALSYLKNIHENKED